jgi:hypothetical protein
MKRIVHKTTLAAIPVLILRGDQDSGNVIDN